MTRDWIGIDVDGTFTDLVAYDTTVSPKPDSTRRRRLELESTGSGFQVSAEGRILTNSHLIQGECFRVANLTQHAL